MSAILRIFASLAVLLFLVLFFSSLSVEGASPVALTISSASFSSGATIPQKHTCDGDDLSPPLAWNGAPSGTKSFALVADDPDAPAGDWTHWLLYDLPAGTTGLPENVAKVENPPTGGRQGRNDFRRIGYAGPCPPPGKTHRYFFKLYALDRSLELQGGVRKQELERAMKGHVLAQAELMGNYER